MTESVEIEKFLDKIIQTMKKGTNTDPIELLEASKVEVSKTKTQDTKTPYRHPNYNKHRIIQQTNYKQNQYEKISKYLCLLKKRSVWNLINSLIQEIITT